MIRFITASGSSYTLDLETQELTREGDKPLRHVDGGTLEGPKGVWVDYDEPPTIGKSFAYYGPPPIYGAWTTPIASIEEIE